MIAYLVFSDLDGTLLNHHNYSFEEAKPALNFLHEQSIPLILVTSKTFSEVIVLRDKLKINSPFIVENGAGIFIPKDNILAKTMPIQESYIKISQAQTYLELRLFFKQLQKKYPIIGFGDMDVEDVMKLTGLTKNEALNAMKRDFTEPFIIEGELDMSSLKDEVQKEELELVQGGRFYHLISKDQDKAKAMNHLTHLYEEYFDKSLKKIALGDSANDFTMLKAADIGVLIPNISGEYADVEAKNIIKAPFAGAKGWNMALLEILNVK